MAPDQLMEDSIMIVEYVPFPSCFVIYIMLTNILKYQLLADRPDAELLQSSDIMGNHTRFRQVFFFFSVCRKLTINRLALNAMVWAAISWCGIIDPVNGTKACITNYHFLNYWAQDGAYKKAGCRDRSDPEKVKYCILPLFSIN